MPVSTLTGSQPIVLTGFHSFENSDTYIYSLLGAVLFLFYQKVPVRSLRLHYLGFVNNVVRT